MREIKKLTKSISSKAELDAIRFRKRSILGGLKSVEDKLMGMLRENEDLLREKLGFYEVKELEERLKQFRDVNKINIQLMIKKKELDLELEETNNSLSLCEMCEERKISGINSFYNTDKDVVIH